MKTTLVSCFSDRRFVFLGVLLVSCVLCIVIVCILCPGVGVAQNSASVVGLEQGERDTMRLDSRMEGREEGIVDSRLSDQKIGYEERKIRLERRADELFRAEEVVRESQERFSKEEEEARAEARRREAEDLQRKKKTVGFLPDL